MSRDSSLDFARLEQKYADIVQRCNGTMYVVNLKTFTLKAAVGDSNSDIFRLLAEVLERGYLTHPSEHYSLLEPLFLGQLPSFKRKKRPIKPSQLGEKNALLLNLMLAIHKGEAEEFVVFSENGDEMMNSMPKPTAVACVFLFKSGDQFKFSSENAGSTPTKFLIELYNKHFLFHYLPDETVAIMHFPGENSLRDAVKEEIILSNAEKKGDKPGFPSSPMVLEELTEKKRAQDQASGGNINERKISRLFVERDNHCYLVGANRAGIPNFAEPYPLSTLIHYHFVLSPKITDGEVMKAPSTEQPNQGNRPPQATAHPNSLNYPPSQPQPLSVRVGGLFQPQQPQVSVRVGGLFQPQQPQAPKQSHHWRVRGY